VDAFGRDGHERDAQGQGRGDGLGDGAAAGSGAGAAGVSPTKIWEQSVPTDPCIYRLYEIVGVYGPTIKTLIQEEFGDGIMSAIDFDMQITRVANPKGDRVKIEMSGKFLGYNSW
jgi:cyanate lyase